MTRDGTGERVVLCFGDSNTHGTCPMAAMNDKRRLSRARRWPGIMTGDLGQGWHVIEEGHPGRTLVHDDPIEGAHKNGMRILPALLETHCPLDLVVVMLGTNDLKARFGVPASDIALSCERLIAEILKSEAGPGQRAPAILLVAPAPIREDGFLGGMFAGGSAKSRLLSAGLAEIATRNGTGFFDAGTVAEVDPLDGIHLTSRSHERLGHAIADAVREMFGEPVPPPEGRTDHAERN